MDFFVTILGSGAATPKRDRQCSSQVVNINGFKMLVDCGEAAQHQVRATHQRMQSLGTIFISHLHGDHIFGLPGLLSSMHLCGRTEPVTVFSPRGLREAMQTLFRISNTVPQYEINYVEIDASEPVEVFRNARCVVTAFPLDHSVPCYGYLFEENQPFFNIRKEAIERYALSPADIQLVKEGADFRAPDGTVVPNGELTLPKRPVHRYAYCCDTAYTESILPVVEGVDLLCMESTFANDFASVAAEKRHCTALQAAQLARKAHVGRLLLTHFSARYSDVAPLLEEAQSVFPDAIAAADGMTLAVKAL